MQRKPECPKCKRQMQEGVVIDRSYGHTFISSWTEGIPEKGMFYGLKLKGKQMVEITTYRCPSCGYLESYAPP